MKIKFLLPLLALAMLFMTGCPYGYKYNEGHFPPEPVNFEAINSMYNDYNMTSPVIEEEQYLAFSSDRNNSGTDYDVVGDYLHVLWDRDNGILTVDDKRPLWKNYAYADTLFSRINTAANETGPYSLPYYSYKDLMSHYTDLVVYSTDQSGDLDLNLVCFEGRGENPGPDSGSYTGPVPVTFLNTGFNECYLSFYGSRFVKYPYGAVPEEIQELSFCSDRDGSYDIFSASVPLNSDILDFLLSDTSLDVRPETVLNSPGEEMCPYIDGKLLVFASDRNGGYGGFDLWYSQRTDTGWGEPKNFGDRINTEYNEFRPIVALYYEFTQDLMLFSSDRPGGKGGYDLYYVGVPKMIE